ncbi:MAG: VTT domain-containing protein [Actinomycetota bacterium]
MLDLLSQHHAWIVFFGAFLFGETLIIPAAAVAAQGHFNIFAVAGSAYAGTVISDAMWFMSARPVSRFLDKSARRRASYEQVLGWVSRRFGERPERALLFIKFVYGARLATIVYLSLRRLALKRFVVLNGVGAACWIVVIVTIGWLAGRGVGGLSTGLAKIEYLLPAILVFTLLLKGLITWVSKRAIEK